MTVASKSIIPKDFLTGREPAITFLVVLIFGVGLYFANGLLALSTTVANGISPVIYNMLFNQLVPYYPTGLLVFLDTVYNWLYSFPSVIAWFIGGIVLGFLLKSRSRKLVASNQTSDIPVAVSKAEVSKIWVIWGLFRVSLIFIALTYAILGIIYVGMTLTGSVDVSLMTGISGFMIYLLTLFLSPVFWMSFALVALGGAIGTGITRKAITPIAFGAGEVTLKTKGKIVGKKEKMLQAYQPVGGKTPPAPAPTNVVGGSGLRVAGTSMPKATTKVPPVVPQNVPATAIPSKTPVIVPVVPTPKKGPEPEQFSKPKTVPEPASTGTSPVKTTVAFPPVPAPITGPDTVPTVPSAAKPPVTVPSPAATIESTVPKMPAVIPLTTTPPQPTDLKVVTVPVKQSSTGPTPESAPAPVIAPTIPTPPTPISDEPYTPEEEQFFKQIMTGMKLVMAKLETGQIIDPAFVSNLLYLLRTRKKKFEQQGAASKIKKVEEMYQKTEELQAQVRARAKNSPQKQ